MMRRIFSPPPLLSSSLRSFSSSSSTKSTSLSSSSSILSQEEVTQINTLIHRLCDSSHFQEAILLLSTCLLATTSNPSPISSIPFLVDRLSSLPSLSPSFSLLTTLLHHNNAITDVPFFSKLLIASFLRKRRLKEASKVFSWMLREDNSSLCRPDEEIYRVYVGGVCERDGEAVEVVRAVREMVRDGLEVDGEEVRGLVWMSMLREARIDEAKELDAAFLNKEDDGVGKLLDTIIREWEE